MWNLRYFSKFLHKVINLLNDIKYLLNHLMWIHQVRVYDKSIDCFGNLIVREGLRKKIRNYLGIFPNIGGGGLLIPKTFVILTIALKTPLKHLKITQKFPTLPKKNRQKMVEIPKRGGWGSNIWEKFPKNSVFFS